MRQETSSGFRLYATGDVDAPRLVWEGPAPATENVERSEARLALLQDHPSTLLARPVAFENDGQRMRLEMEGAPGTRLAQLLRRGGLRPDMALDFAVQLAEAVEALHNRRIAHGHISPDAIFVNVETRTLRLALPPDCLTQPPNRPFGIEGREVGDLLYCAPEQGGRTEAVADLRADLYALGAVFHEMLSGAPPFESVDRFELLHLHLAVPPPDLSEMLPEVPPTGAKLVLRLLEKAPRDRYQTAYGLLADLRRCRDAVSRDGTIPPFDLGASDALATFSIPDRLYGRETVLGTLDAALARVAAGGVEVVLLTGPSGSGKSAVAERLRDVAVADATALFGYGKYDRIQSEPYLGLQQALRDVVMGKLSGDSADLDRFRAALRAGLGDTLPELVEFVPELRHLLGDATPQRTGDQALQSTQRFRLALQAFFEVLPAPGAPLVLHLDDLHWADNDSIALLGDILLGASLSGVMIVGTCRHDELQETHRLRGLPGLLEPTAIGFASVEIGPMSVDDTSRMIRDTLHLPPSADVSDLARLIQARTLGNAFHVRRLLSELYREGAIRFDPRAGRWDWTMDTLTERVVETDVARLMGARLRQLSAPAFETLCHAAVFGTRFVAGALRMVSAQPEDEIKRNLREAAEDGFLMPVPGGEADVYRFSHEIVRSAAYDALPEARRQELHFRIGAILLKEITDPAGDERLFVALDQIALGAALITEPSIGRRVTQAAIHGARRARAVAAYDIALTYLDFVQALPEAVTGVGWNTEPEMREDLAMEAMQVGFLTGGFAAAEPHFRDLLGHLPDPKRRAAVYQVMVTLHTSRSEYARAIEFGVEGLKLLGVNLAGSRGAKIGKELLAAQLALRRHDVADFSGLPDMDDPDAEQLIGMLMIVSTPAFLQDKDLYVLIALRMLRVTLRKGLTSPGVFAIWNYAIVIYLTFGSVEKAHRIALGLFDILGPRAVDPLVRGRFTYTYCVVLAWHFRRYPDLRDMLEGGLKQSWAAADLEYVGYHYYSILKYTWLAADPLPALAEKLDDFARIDRRLNHEVLSSITRIYGRAVARLTDPGPPALWSHEDRALEGEMTGEASVGSFCTTQLLLVHVQQDWSIVGELAERLRALESFATLGPEFADYHLLLGLSLTRAPAAFAAVSRRRRRAGLKRHLAALRRLAETFPDNHRFQHPLLAAEVARAEGRLDAALPLYETAARRAEDARAWHYAGIACECAAALAAAMDDAARQAGWIARAHAAYARWGAINKTRMIEADRPDLAPPAVAIEKPRPGQADDAHDMTSIIKASQVILEVSDVDTLVARLLHISIENAGADAGALYLVEEDGSLRLAAEAEMNGARVEVEVPATRVPLDDLDPTRYPREIVAQVAASRAPVVLSDARTARRYAQLRYVTARAPRSFLCLPVKSSQGLKAVLHLENTLSEAVFSIERQDVLGTLASLAAIALSNAMLYSQQREALALEQRASEELARINRLKDDFLASTSHELRTPLNGIIGLADALAAGAKGALPDEARDTLRLIVSSGSRLAALVTDILDLSRLREDDLALVTRPTDLHAAVEVVTTLMQPRARAGGVTLTNAVPEGAMTVMADEDRLQQILLNLLDNAVKFTDGGTVTVSSAMRDGRVVVSVADTGIGIPPDAQERIFDSFVKVDASDTSARSGIGLGLAIAARLVEMHGGRITVASEPGAGATFSFDLAATSDRAERRAQVLPSRVVTGRWAEAETEMPGDAARASAATAPGDLVPAGTSEPLIRPGDAEPARNRVLVIDDDPVNLEVVRNYLALDGFAMETARSGPEGLARIEAGFAPDIVLLDVMMPGMSGYEVCRRLRASFPPAVLPVVMLTAKNQVEDLRAGFEAGATDYLVKPFSRDELTARMKAHIALARVTSAYERFVPVEFLRFLGRDSVLDLDLGDSVARRMTVMFSDIRGFTGIAEKLSPEGTFAFLNEYFSRIGPLVKANRGVVNQYFGDGMMSLFPGNPDEGVEAAVQIMREVRRINIDRAAGGHSAIGTGIGLHTGDLIMGILGDGDRLNGNVVSDAVNLAARLEGVTGQYGVGIAVSEDVIAALSRPERMPHRRLATVRVVGRERPVAVHEIFAADPPEIAALKAQTRDDFEAAHDLLRAARFAEAQARYAAIAARAPGDQAAARLAERAAVLARDGATGTWTGVDVLSEK